MSSKRLSSDAWIDAGLSNLAEAGPGVLKAEVMARKMGTTKGSFYWHFKDLPDYHTRVAEAWKRRAAQQLVTALESEDPPAERLRHAGAAVPGEAAMRAWAQENAAAAKALGEIDHLRLDATSALLGDLGISNPEIARALYAAAVGMSALGGSTAKRDRAAMATLIDLVLALR